MKTIATNRTRRLIVAVIAAAAAVAIGLAAPSIHPPAQPVAELDTSPN